MRLLLPIALVFASACATGEAAENPPPARDGVGAVVPPIGPPTGPAATPPTGPAATPLSLRARSEDPARTARIGRQRAVVYRLLDRLDLRAIELPVELPGPVDKDGLKILGPTSRSYPNPWRAGALGGADRRLNWQTGSKNEWRLSQSLVLPAGGAASWPVTTPASARLDLDLTAARRPKVTDLGAATVRLVFTPAIGAPVEQLVTLATTEYDKPLVVTPVRLPLPQGPGVLRLETRGPVGVIVSASVPVITSDDPEAVRAATGLPGADNVILIVVDALRSDVVGPYAAKRGRPRLFPTMDGLFDAGTGFLNAFSPGNQTRLSTYSFLSSQWARYGRWHSVRWPLPAEDKARFYAGSAPLAGRVLDTVGYRTASIGNNVFLFGHIDVGLDAAFDEVVDHRNSVQDTPWMTDSAIGWLEAHRDERFFLVLNYNSPHRPYEPPEDIAAALAPALEAAGERVSPVNHKYLGEVAWVDGHLKRFLEQVDRLGLSEKTVIAFTADHGELFDERHRCIMDNGKACHNAHGITLFDEELHVPVAIRQPGRIAAGRTLSTNFSLIDLMPTFEGLAGFDPHPDHFGRDWSTTLTGGAEPEEVPIRSEGRRSTAIRFGGFKYQWNHPNHQLEFVEDALKRPAGSNEDLYDVAADPFELVNLVGKAPPELLALRQRLFDQDDALDARRGGPIATWQVRARGTGKITGKFTTNGRFVEAKVGDREVPSGGGTLDVDFPAPARLTFRTVPRDALLNYSFTVDGKDVPSKDVGVGPYGLALVDNGRIESARRRAWAAAPTGGPSIPDDTGPKLLLWREDAEALKPVAAHNADAADAEVRALMKSWGYQ